MNARASRRRRKERNPARAAGEIAQPENTRTMLFVSAMCETALADNGRRRTEDLTARRLLRGRAPRDLGAVSRHPRRDPGWQAASSSPARRSMTRRRRSGRVWREGSACAPVSRSSVSAGPKLSRWPDAPIVETLNAYGCDVQHMQVPDLDQSGQPVMNGDGPKLIPLAVLSFTSPEATTASACRSLTPRE